MSYKVQDADINNSKSKYFRIWTVVLFIVVVLGTLTLLATLKNNYLAHPDYGVFLDRGIIDSWKYENGLVTMSIGNDQDQIKNYSIYVSKLTNIIAASSSSDSPNSFDKKSIRSGNFSEISEGKYIEVYLKYPYEDARRGATTIIYWE